MLRLLTSYVDEATQFIRSPSEKPFFMYWAINAPHYPMQGTSKWRDHYRHLDSPRRQYAEFGITFFANSMNAFLN